MKKTHKYGTFLTTDFSDEIRKFESKYGKEVAYIWEGKKIIKR